MNAIFKIWALSIGIILGAWTTSTYATNDTIAYANANLKPTGHHAFRAGEDLTFSVKYGFIKGGEAHFYVSDTIINGRRAEHISVGGRTTGLADAIYEVRDTYESFMDKKTQLPLVSIRSIKEGKYRYFDRTTYDNTNGNVSIHKETRRGVNDTTLYVGRNMLDIVSAF